MEARIAAAHRSRPPASGHHAPAVCALAAVIALAAASPCRAPSRVGSPNRHATAARIRDCPIHSFQGGRHAQDSHDRARHRRLDHHAASARRASCGHRRSARRPIRARGRDRGAAAHHLSRVLGALHARRGLVRDRGQRHQRRQRRLHDLGRLEGRGGRGGVPDVPEARRRISRRGYAGPLHEPQRRRLQCHMPAAHAGDSEPKEPRSLGREAHCRGTIAVDARVYYFTAEGEVSGVADLKIIKLPSGNKGE